MSLTIITGPMYAGKSSRLISMCLSNVIAGNKVMAFKPSTDNRYERDYIVTHTMDKFSSIPIDPAKPYSCMPYIVDMSKDSPVNVLAFDECQFFDKYRFAQFITQLLYIDKTYSIICAGLSSDSDGRPFGAMPDILCIADEIISLKAVCSSCKRIDAATRTYRKGPYSQQTLVGGQEAYSAMCYSCWIKDALNA